MADVNNAILERLESVVISLQDNSIKMGQLLAVHQEKLAQQEKADDILFRKIEHLHTDLHTKTDEIKKGCERDILLVKDQISGVEKKLYIAAGAIAAVTFIANPAVLKFAAPLLNASSSARIEASVPVSDELSRPPVRDSIIATAPELF